MQPTWALTYDLVSDGSGIAANTMAGALLKTAALRNGNLANPVLIAVNCRLLLAVGLYGLAFLIYATAASWLTLNIARPITTADAIIVVGLASMFVFGERVPVGSAVGDIPLLARILALFSAGR